MGRIYAGVLGPVAFLTVLIRGWKDGADSDAALLAAWLGLVVMASVGYVAGRLAQGIVEDSVRTRIAQELAAQENALQTATGNPQG